jgi:ribosomal protein L17
MKQHLSVTVNDKMTGIIFLFSGRYCLCRNPHTAGRETTTRRELLERTKLELERIGTTALKSHKTKKPASDAIIGARIGTALAKTKMGKHVKRRSVWKTLMKNLALTGRRVGTGSLQGCG